MGREGMNEEEKREGKLWLPRTRKFWLWKKKKKKKRGKRGENNAKSNGSD